MDKYEFLDELKTALNGKVEVSELNDSLKYYEDYINMQERLGKPESEVMRSLGSPRLIAKTILSANDQAQVYEENTSQEQDVRQGSRVFSLLGKFMLLPKWARIAIGAAAAAVIVWLVFTILKALLPIIIILFVVVFCIRFFRNLQ